MADPTDPVDSEDTDTPVTSGTFQGGTLSVFEEHVDIERSSRSMFDDKRIEMDDIYAIEFSKGFVTGHLQIKQTGVDPDTGGFLSHPVDENTVYFPRNKRPDAEAVRDAILERIEHSEQ